MLKERLGRWLRFTDAELRRLAEKPKSTSTRAHLRPHHSLSLRVELNFGKRASIAKIPEVFGVEYPDSPGIPAAGREHS